MGDGIPIFGTLIGISPDAGQRLHNEMLSYRRVTNETKPGEGFQGRRAVTRRCRSYAAMAAPEVW